MGVVLVFTCPETGRDVPVHVLRGGEALTSLSVCAFDFACMECGGKHSWTIGEGRLQHGER